MIKEILGLITEQLTRPTTTPFLPSVPLPIRISASPWGTQGRGGCRPIKTGMIAAAGSSSPPGRRHRLRHVRDHQKYYSIEAVGKAPTNAVAQVDVYYR
jgi:hypothetical protein